MGCNPTMRSACFANYRPGVEVVIKARIANDRRAEIIRLADYSKEVAGGLMNSPYADLDATTTCGEAVW